MCYSEQDRTDVLNLGSVSLCDLVRTQEPASTSVLSSLCLQQSCVKHYTWPLSHRVNCKSYILAVALRSPGNLSWLSVLFPWVN